LKVYRFLLPYLPYTKRYPTLKTVTKNNLEQNLKEATSNLLEMARNSCWNEISDNTNFIISEIVNDEQNISKKQIERKKANERKTPKSLEQIATELKAIYENLYDIILYIYKSKKENTIIEIQYYPKSSFESDFFETVKDNEPMLHMKVGIPPLLNNKTEKYDVNWELGGIRYEWNFFWRRMKFKWKYRNRINVG
jgi:hypothetical protein